jgi:4'-phosphopantetheinyl transferase
MTTVAPLEADTVRVRWLATDGRSRAHMPRWRGLLDDEERARADRFRFVKDRDAFIAAHALLRSMLSEAAGSPPGAWRYSLGRYGKPALAEGHRAGGLRFSLAHTHGLAACAIARDDIGVDVEASDRRADLEAVDQYLAPAEVLAVRTAPPERRRALFFRFWTLKEAFIKATGEGLHRDLASFSFTLDPPRISFRPTDDGGPHQDDPAGWRFAERRPREDRPLAIAVRWPAARPFQLDAGPDSLFCEA